MNTYILLFRGINVGGHHLLPMKALAEMLENCGYQQVKTYIQSGNVVLNSNSRPSTTVIDQIEQHFGFRPQLMVLDMLEFKAAVNNNPFTADQGKTIHFYFMDEAPSPDIEKINTLAVASESYLIRDHVFYLHAPDGIGRSKLAAQVEKCMGVAATARNLNTVNKLLEMVAE